MATGKKGKKTKGKTVDLSTFLQDTPGPLPTAPIRKNWADEVEDSYDGSYEPRSKTNVVLPTAPKASRDYEDISEKVPKDPPYMAYLSNLPYDVDEEEIAAFFKNMKIARMNIPKDERPGEIPKLKGFGYVEFADRDSLINALVIPDTTLKSRRIRIEVAANSENEKRRGRMDMNRQDKSETFSGNWRTAPRSENNESEQRSYNRDNREGGFNRDNRDRDRDRDREDDKPGAWRDGERTNRDSDRNYSRGRDYDTDRGDRGGGRYGDKRGGFTERRGFSDRGYGDRDDRRNRDDDSGRLEGRQRPKLNLAPRTKPVETVTSESVPSASIFGNAKPVDTAQKDRQIEERLAKEHVKPRENSRERHTRHHSDDEDRRSNDKREISRRDDSPVHERPSSQNKKHDDDRRRVIEEDNRRDPEEDRRRVPEEDRRRVPEEDRRRVSEEDRRRVPEEDRRPPPPKNDTIKHTEDKKNEKPPKREEKKDRLDKEMPRLKEPEAPNFAQNNKFAYLQDENSD